MWSVNTASDHKVDVRAIRELIGAQHQFGSPKALLATTSTFTETARVTAEAAGGLDLVDSSLLLEWIGKYTRAKDAPSFAESRRFKSCFVSYSHHDDEFVTVLVGRLRTAGVRVWYAPEDLVGGRKVDEEVARAIKTFDRLLVVLSKHSMNSDWVKSEIKKARTREIEEGCRVLFPVSLVPFDELRRWQLFDADVGHDLANELRQYYIPDFSLWHDSPAFNTQFEKIMSGLSE